VSDAGVTARFYKAVSDARLAHIELEPQAGTAGGSWDVELELGNGMVLRLRRPC